MDEFQPAFKPKHFYLKLFSYIYFELKQTKSNYVLVYFKSENESKPALTLEQFLSHVGVSIDY